MISRSGIIYDLKTGVPTVDDVALSLSRLPRWCGATRNPWSVAQHSLHVEALLDRRGCSAFTLLAGLTHDVDEGLGWGDISSALKPESVRAEQLALRTRVVSDWLGPMVHWITGLWSSVPVKADDKRASYIERYAMMDGLGPASSWSSDEHFRELNLLDDLGYYSYYNNPSIYQSLLVKRFNELKQRCSDLYVMPFAAPGSLRCPVAGEKINRETSKVPGTSRTGPDFSNGCKGWPKSAGGFQASVGQALSPAARSKLGKLHERARPAGGTFSNTNDGVYWCAGCEQTFEGTRLNAHLRHRCPSPFEAETDY